MLTFVKFDSTTEFAYLWKFDIKKGGWFYSLHRVPLIPNDSRFRINVKRFVINENYFLFKVGKSPERGDKPVKLSDRLLDEIANEPENNVDPPFDTRIFDRYWHEVDSRPVIKQLTKLEKLISDKSDVRLKQLVKRYRRGEKLPLLLENKVKTHLGVN